MLFRRCIRRKVAAWLQGNGAATGAQMLGSAPWRIVDGYTENIPLKSRWMFLVLESRFESNAGD